MSFDFTWRELVRRRPGMYIGPTDQRALVALVCDLIDQAIEDFRDPPCQQVSFTLMRSGMICVDLDGGVPRIRQPPGQSWLPGWSVIASRHS